MKANQRTQPTVEELASWPTDALLSYAERESIFLTDQKQTAVPRLIREMALRIKQCES